jgi:hypothetical protein
MAFDRWNTHRDMLLRITFLENKVLLLESMQVKNAWVKV